MDNKQALMRACLGEFELMDDFRQGMTAGLAVRLHYADEDEGERPEVPTLVVKRKKKNQMEKGA